MAAVILFSPAGLVRAEVIDRIAATVGKKVITESQVMEEIRVTAFLDGKAPDWSKDNREKTVNRLVDQALIHREIDATRFPEAPIEEGAKLLDQLKSGMKNFAPSLAALRLSEPIVQKHLQWQVTFLRFVEFRFKPGVEVSEADLKEFYASQFKEWRKQGKPVPEFQEVRGDLERLLASKYVDQALDRWLGDQRTETAIVFKGEKKAQP
jgi:peptidyl-prolyl cis-trans isomerase SurA